MTNDIKRLLDNSDINTIINEHDSKKIGSGVEDITNQMEVTSIKKSIGLFGLTLKKASKDTNFVKEINYLKSKDFDIKKLRRYEVLKNAYDIAKENSHEPYNKYYCDLFEYLTSPKHTKLVNTMSKKAAFSFEDFDYRRTSVEGKIADRLVDWIVRSAIFLSRNKWALVLTVSIYVIITVLFVLGSIIVLKKIITHFREKNDNNKQTITYNIEDDESGICRYMINPSKPIFRFIDNFSSSADRHLNDYDKKVKQLRQNTTSSKEDLIGVFGVIGVIFIGVPLLLFFLRWTVSFILNLKSRLIESYERVDEILKYRIETIEETLRDPNISPVERKNLEKIRQNLEDYSKGVREKIERNGSTFSYLNIFAVKRIKQSVSATVEDTREDEKIYDSSTDQTDDDVGSAPNPVFI